MVPDLTPYSSFWDRHDTLKQIRALAEAQLVTPWALLGVTLARVLSAAPPQIQLPPIIGGPASLNFFVALTGPSGSSKSTTVGCCYSNITVEGEAQQENLGSGEGLAMVFLDLVPQGPGLPKILMRNTTLGVVYMVDEITTLGELGARDGSTIQSVLRSAWSGGRLGQKNADTTRDRRVEAHDYRLCMVCGIQPRRSAVLFNEEGSGSPQRFVWLPTVDPNMVVDDDDSDQILDGMVINMPRFPDVTTQVRICPEARRQIRQAHAARQRGEFSQVLDGHLLLCQLKVATALALLCDKRLEVTQEWWEAAAEMMEVSNLTREWAAAGSYEELRSRARHEGDSFGIRNSQADDSKIAETCRRVGSSSLRFLEEAGDAGATRSQIRLRVNHIDRNLIHTERVVDPDTGKTHAQTYSNFDLAWDTLVQNRQVIAVRFNRVGNAVFKRADQACPEYTEAQEGDAP